MSTTVTSTRVHGAGVGDVAGVGVGAGEALTTRAPSAFSAPASIQGKSVKSGSVPARAGDVAVVVVAPLAATAATSTSAAASSATAAASAALPVAAPAVLIPHELADPQVCAFAE